MIIVLTDKPALYGQDLFHNETPPVFVNSIDALIDKLRDVSVAGLVLEVNKVMKASRRDKDRLFKYSGNFPVLRTRPNSKLGFIQYLDPRDRFFANLDIAAGKRLRSHDRQDISIDCILSKEDDPSMATPVEGTILNISPGGCFVNTRQFMENEQFIHLRIPRLSNSRPIYSSIRWTRKACDAKHQCGIGVMFIDLTDDQLEEIETISQELQVTDK